VDQEHADGIARAWDQAVLAAGGRETSISGTTQALESLPDFDAWTLAKGGAELYGLAGKRLFTVIVGEDGAYTVTRRPLRGKDIIVSLTRSAPKPTDAGAVTWETEWTFRYVDEQKPEDGWQQVRGSVSFTNARGERLDQGEEFARAVASRAGWTIPIRDTSG
jgi:hypothetical protein